MNLADIIREVVHELLEFKRKRVIRKGKKKLKIICPKGMKVVGGKCVKQKAAERAKRKRASKRGAVKAKSKKARTARKRLKSLKKRKRFGFK